jgi:hypothetical protein
MQFFVGEFLFIEFPFDSLKFVVEIFEIVLVESALMLELFFEVVWFLREIGLKLLDCAALLFEGVGKGDDLFLEVVGFRVTGFQIFLEFVDAWLVSLSRWVQLMFQLCDLFKFLGVSILIDWL